MATNVHPSLFILLRSLQACSDPKSRPGFMTDKALESAIKYIVRKFPLTDAKVSESVAQQFIIYLLFICG